MSAMIEARALRKRAGRATLAVFVSGRKDPALLRRVLADLRRIRARFVAELKGRPGIRFAPSNDLKGDCGVVVSFQFEKFFHTSFQ